MPIVVRVLSLVVLMHLAGADVLVHAGDKGPTPSASAAADKVFLRFWERFQRAVAGDDKQALAAMTVFPLEGASDAWGEGDPEAGFGREEFLKHYGEIFAGPVKAEIARSRPDACPRKTESRWCLTLNLQEGAGEEDASEFTMIFEFARIGKEYKLRALWAAG